MMTTRFPRVLLLAALLAAAAGCASQRVNYLTEQRYKPMPKDEPVRLFLNRTERPHMEIAQVQSYSTLKDTEETRRAMLADLRARAGKIGADAVVDIRVLRNKSRGFTIDEAVPFRAYTQGNWESIFLRGVAIRFLEPEEPAPPHAAE